MDKDGLAIEHECTCPCHAHGGIHIMACCAGQCPGCKKHIKLGFWDAHQKECIECIIREAAEEAE